MAAHDNLTGTAQIQVQARRIDFVTSFARNWQHLAEILGITRLIEAVPGTELTSKYAEGKLEDGNVAEGDFIPRSRYTVKEKPYDKINIEKYSKETSIEAVQAYGFDIACNMCDDEFQVDLQERVTGKFYKRLKTGSTKFKERTLQMAFAMGIGAVKREFKKMHKTATGIAVFINTLDLYAYLGDANITVQSAFGLDYIKNFLGADIVFITNEIKRGQLIATPVNNIVGYHMNPASSDFAKMDLVYTTDELTNLIGFAVKGDYDRATSVSYALLGLILFAEYENAIAIVTIDKDAKATETLSDNYTVDDEADSEDAGDDSLTGEP